MTDAPLVSVYVPCYNEADKITGCLESLRTQTYENLEIIVLDDGSTDDSASQVRSFMSRDGRVRLINMAHEGLSAVRNRALTECRGQWIVSVDGDDYVEPGFIGRLVSAAVETGADIVMCGYSVTGRKDRFHEARTISGREEIHKFFLTLGRGDNFAWGKLYKKECFEGVEYPVDRAYEDLATLPYVIENTEKLVLCPDVLYHYELSASGITAGNMKNHIEGYENTKKRILFYKEKYPSLVRYAKRASMEFGLFVIKKRLQSIF